MCLASLSLFYYYSTINVYASILEFKYLDFLLFCINRFDDKKTIISTKNFFYIVISISEKKKAILICCKSSNNHVY